MSALHELLVVLASVNGDAGRYAAELVAQSRRLEAAARSAAALGATSGRIESVHTASSLQSASTAVAQAARHLHQASLLGERFVARNTGRPPSGASVPMSELDRPSPVAAATPSIADIATWLEGINPGYTDDPFDPRSNNCGTCAAAVFSRLEGTDPMAVASMTTLRIEEMEVLTGRRQVAMSPDDIRAALVAAGPGAHAVIGIDRAIGPGHWFNAYFDGQQVVAIDGQTGEIVDWPPQYGSAGNPVVQWDMGELR